MDVTVEGFTAVVTSVLDLIVSPEPPAEMITYKLVNTPDFMRRIIKNSTSEAENITPPSAMTPATPNVATPSGETPPPVINVHERF